MTLDDDVAAKLKADARRSGRSFKEVVNDVLRRGLVAYDSGDAARIAGLKSADIEQTIGYRGRDEIIHRDDLVMTNGER